MAHIYYSLYFKRWRPSESDAYGNMNRRGEVDGLLAAVRTACRYPAKQDMRVTSKVSIFKDLTY